MKDKSKRDSAQLSLDCYNWLHRQVYSSGRGAGFFATNGVDREKTLVHLVRDGKDYILGFKDPTNERKFHEFFVYLGETYPRQQELIKTALTENLKKLNEENISTGENERVVKAGKFREIFGKAEPSISYDSVQFNKNIYNGIRVALPIVNIPQAREGGLSENLFVYFEEEILRPAARAIHAEST